MLKVALEKENLSLDKALTLKGIVLQVIEDHTAEALQRHGVVGTPKAEVHAKRLAGSLQEVIENQDTPKVMDRARVCLKLYRKDYPDEIV